MEWKRVRLGDSVLCNPTVKLTKGELYPVIDIDKITVGRKFVSNKSFLAYTGQSGCKFENGDTLMARITPCLENGKIAVAKVNGKGIGSTELFVFREKENITYKQFVYYLLKQQYIRNLAANSMTGASGRQRADLKFIKRIKLDLPPLPVQHRIASILSAYDSLIENNTKRIRLLEKMAENLYKEWFVRFRFPGYEKAEMENGLPKGWKISRIKDFGRIETGKTPSTKKSEYYGGKILFVKTPDMHEGFFVSSTEETLSDLGSESQEKKLLPPYSIMVSCIGTGGVVAINAKPAHTNQQINSIILSDASDLEWIFMVCKGLKTTIELFGATGATMTNLSKGKFEKLKVIEPPNCVRYDFHNKTRSTFKLIQELSKQNSLLARRRDLLLPRLMSGKLEVKP